VKKLLLILLLSLGFTASADTITYDSFGRGSDGSQCRENTIGGIDCYGGDIDGNVRYRLLGGRFNGDDGSTCRINYVNKLECNRKAKVSKNYNIDPNVGRATVSGAGQSGSMLASGLISILESLLDASSSSNNSKSTTSSGYGGSGDIPKSTSSSSSKFMPPNSYMSSSGWICKIGYVRNNNGCIPDTSSVLNNATQVVDGWVCNYGYKKISNTRCVKK